MIIIQLHNPNPREPTATRAYYDSVVDGTLALWWSSTPHTGGTFTFSSETLS